MIRTHLISEATLKANMPVKNVDSAYITPAIQLAQDLGLQPIIGTNLMESIATKVDNETIGSEANKWYKTLLDEYIEPYLIHQTMYKLEPMLFAKMRNNGVLQANGEGYSNASNSDANALRNEYANNANAYAERMVAFLKANSIHFKEWMATRDQADLPSNKGAFNNPIYLGL